MEEGAGPNLARGLGTGAPRDLETLHVEQQWWHQESAGTILRPLGNRKNMMPIELVDFGWMLDVHKSFLNVSSSSITNHGSRSCNKYKANEATLVMCCFLGTRQSVSSSSRNENHTWRTIRFEESQRSG